MKLSDTDRALMGEDLQDLLQHVSWKEVIQPKLHELKSHLLEILTQSVLGHRYATRDGGEITKEQIAGEIHGINTIERLIESILRDGSKAQQRLNERMGLYIRDEEQHTTRSV